MKTRLLLLFALYTIFSNSQTPKKDFQFVNIKEGISKVAVSSIIQDNKGFIWISTLGAGLYRFDGIEYTSYKSKFQDSTSISSNRIKCSFIDSKNRLWVGTENGLNLYDKDLNNFKRYQFSFKDLNNNEILSLQEDSSNNLLMGSNGDGLFKLNLNTFEISRVLNSEEQSQQLIVNSLVLTKQGKVFAGTNTGLKEVDVHNNKLIPTRVFSQKNHRISTSIETLFLDNKNNLWIGAQKDEGIYQCELSSDRNNNILKVQNFNISPKKIMTIVQLKDSTILVGTENAGLFHLENNGAVIKNYVASKTEENSILHNSIWELFLDKDQRIWMGYYNSGVAIHDDLYDKFKNIKSLSNKENSLKAPSVMGVIKRGNDNLWVATDGGGIDVYNQLTEKITHINTEDTSIYSGLTSDYIISIFKDSKGNIWAGSWDNGIYFLKKDSKKFINYNIKNNLFNQRFFPFYLVQSIL
jgi:ligand-binding sensor domain-containing protein